jgi:membrane protein YdbS with pleckstrin-like domain
MRKIIVKEGPLVFLRNVLAMEVVAAIFFYAISYLTDYQMAYDGTLLAHYFAYERFIMVAFSLFQLVYILILFLQWYFSHFEITEKEIVRKSGLLFRHRKFVNLGDVSSVEVYESPLGRMMKHATIILHHENGKVTKIKNVLSADEYAHIIKQIVHPSAKGEHGYGLPHLITAGEGRFVEFKETLRWDTHRNTVSKDMEKVVLKTIVAFLNADGGTLVIGVSDSAEIVGLEKDYQTLPKKNRDGFENHLSQLVKTHIGLPFAKYVSIIFEKVNDCEVCIVSVGASHRPAYLHNGGDKEDFFVRVGNASQPFSMSETEEYIKTRWK